MSEALAIAALAIAAANVLFVAVLIARRILAGRRERERVDREARVAPLVHRLIDTGEAPDALDDRDQVALARVLARMSRLVRGEARVNIAAYFRGSGAYAAQLAALDSRRAWRRAAAAFALGDMAVPEAVPALLRSLDDNDRDVRAAAARSLGRLQALEAVQPLVRRLADRSLPRLVTGSALLAVGNDAVGALRPLVAAPNGEVRAAAVELIGLVGTAVDADVLEAALADPDPGVRARAAAAVGRLGGAHAAAAVAAALADPVADVRAAAARALGVIGERAVVEQVIELAAHDEFAPAHAAAHAAAALDPGAVTAAADRSPHLREVADLLAL